MKKPSPAVSISCPPFAVNAFAQNPAVNGTGLGKDAVTRAPQQLRRLFDVAEEEGHRAGGQRRVAHLGLSRLTVSCHHEKAWCVAALNHRTMPSYLGAGALQVASALLLGQRARDAAARDLEQDLVRVERPDAYELRACSLAHAGEKLPVGTPRDPSGTIEQRQRLAARGVGQSKIRFT